MNVSGHRISTIEVESALVDHQRVAEAAVCGRTDAQTGQAIVAYVTLKGGDDGSLEMLEELRDHVGDEDRADREAREHRLHARSCRRRAAARSCAGCSATWPRTARSATRRRSRTRPWSRRSRRARPPSPPRSSEWRRRRDGAGAPRPDRARLAAHGRHPARVQQSRRRPQPLLGTARRGAARLPVPLVAEAASPSPRARSIPVRWDGTRR